MSSQQRVEAKPLLPKGSPPTTSSDEEDTAEGNKGKPPKRPGQENEQPQDEIELIFERPEDDDDEDLSVKAMVTAFKTGSVWTILWQAVITSLHALYIFLLETWVSVRYVTSDSKRNKRNFVVAVITIVIVVTFVVSLSSAIDKSPLVFIKLAENTLGEFDVVFTPLGSPVKLWPKELATTYGLGRNTSLSIFLNCTDMQRRLASVPEIAGASPRWTMLGRVGNRLAPERNASAIILIIDSQQEKDIGLGRAWGFKPLGERQAIVSGPLLRNIGVQSDASDWMTLTIDLIALADTFGFSKDAVHDGLKTLFRMGVKGITKDRNITLNAANASMALHMIEDALNVTIPPLVRAFLMAQLNIYFDSSPTGPLVLDLNRWLTDPVIDSIFDLVYSPDLLQSSLRLESELQVAGSVEDPSGKWPSTLGSVVVLEAKYVPFLIFKDWLPAALRDNPSVVRAILMNLPHYPPEALLPGKNIDQMLSKFPVDEYALMVMVQKRDRLDLYMQDLAERDVETIKWTNKMMLALGLDLSVSTELPINDFLVGADIARAFLAQLLIAMLVVLLLHSMLVIYSLLLSNTEDRTYEYGMLRALGLKHTSLIQLLTIQALYYSVPAIVIGLILGFFAYIPIAYFIASYSATTIDVTFSWSAVMTAVLLGVMMPIVANIVPIRRALSQTLRDALDLYHQRFAETVVRIVKLESLGISIEQTVWSLIMTFFGFALIYIVPLAFRYQYWQVFIGILNATLLGMVMGLAMIAGVLQQKVEGLMLHVLLWGRLKKLKNIVRKSLNAHGDRNRKTALMFTTVVAFVIFASSAFHFQTASVVDNIKVLSGSDIVFQSVTYSAPLDEEKMTAFLQQEKGNPGTKLKSWSYATYPLSSDPAVVRTSISNIAGQPMSRTSIWGVDENYMETMYDEYFVKTDIDDSFTYAKTEHGMPDVIRSLYTDAGKARLPLEKLGFIIPPVIGTGPVPSMYNKKSKNDTSYIDTNHFPTLFSYRDQSSVPYVVYRDENTTYTDYLDVIVSTAMHGINLYIQQPIYVSLQFRITKSDHQSRVEYLAKPRAFASKVPGFFFSWLELLSRVGQPMLVSMDTFSQLNLDMYYARMNASEISDLKVPADWIKNFSPTPKKSKLLIRMANDASRDEREFVVNGLKNFVKSDLILVSDTTELINSSRFAISLLMLFFYVISTIAVVLCFFVLWISFTANVRENSWEFGVLRAIGLSIWEVIFVYIFEALSIILTSVILATSIGISVSLTLTMQYTLFNDMEMTFYFPTTMFVFLFVMSVAVSMLGSYLPANLLGKKQIASTIRGH